MRTPANPCSHLATHMCTHERVHYTHVYTTHADTHAHAHTLQSYIILIHDTPAATWKNTTANDVAVNARHMPKQQEDLKHTRSELVI